MNKAVLISIRPEWCEKIASGQKTIEVRKTRPKLDTPFKVYVYQTIPKWGDINDRQGRVFCEFTCDRTIEGIKVEYKHGYYGFDSKMLSTMKASMLLPEQIYDYLKDKTGYGWHISDLVIYDKPKELNEFIRPGSLRGEELDDHICLYCDLGDKRLDNSCEKTKCSEAYIEYLAYENFVIDRPPQSWCYVEEL